MSETLKPLIETPSLMLALLMALTLVTPFFCLKLRIPEIVGLIAVGMAAGPYGFNLIGPSREGLVYMLGQAGLLYILFQSGLETDLHQFLRARKRSFVFGLLTFAIPQLGGMLAGFALHMDWPAAILLGSVFASHTLLTYPVASRLGLSKYEPVTIAVGATVVTNLVALLILAAVARHSAGKGGWLFWVELVLYACLMGMLVFRFVPDLARWYLRNVPDHGGGQYLLIMTLMFACAYATHFAGLEAILGAFAAGLALNRLIPEQSALMSRLRFVGDTLFVPMFLLFIGMLANVWSLLGEDVNRWLAGFDFGPSKRTLAMESFNAARTWTAALLMGGGIVACKYLPAWISARLFGFTRDDARLMFGLTVVQAAATLAAVLVGMNIKLFDAPIMDGTIFMILVSCLAGSWATERYGQRIAERRAAAEPAAGDDAPPRILLPLANPANMEKLVDLALLMRNRQRQSALFPIMVASPGDGPDAAVARCEELLGKAVARAAAAETPAVPLVRLDVNVVEGLLRAVAEVRATAVLLGWVRSPRAGAFFLGGIFDQLVESCPARLYVARIVRPPEVSKRLLWLVGAHAMASADFPSTARTVKRLAGQAGVAGAEVVTRDADHARLRQQLDALAPELPLRIHAKSSDDAMLRTFWQLAKPDDLMAVTRARIGAASDASLFDLPRRIAEHFPENTLLAAYSALGDPGGADFDPIYSARRL